MVNDTITKMRGFTFSKKNVKKVIAGLVILAIAASILVYGLNKTKPTSASALTQRTARVMKGDFNITVTGEGSVASSSIGEITSAVDGKLKKINFKKGDTIKAGDLLYEMDDSAAQLNVEKLKASLAQAELTQNNYNNQLANLSVKAPFSGKVSKISVEQNDSVSKGISILTITDLSKLKFTVPFNSSQISEITVGKIVTVNIMDLMQSIEGTVSYVNNSAYSTLTGGELYNVEIVVNNPWSLIEGMKANAEISTSRGTLSSTANGSLSYINNKAIKCESAGTVNKLNVKDGQYVNSGEILAEISSDELIVNSESNYVKILDYRSQLEEAQTNLANYKFYSTLDGTIVTQSLNVGDNIKTKQVMCTIQDMTKMECAIPVDELDITKIKVGQKVSLTADALTETTKTPLEGEVINIAVVGTGSNGVTNYPVTVKINNPTGLRSGMNVNVNIFIESKTAALYLPIEAIQKVQNNTFVMVKGDGTQSSEVKVPVNASEGTAVGGKNRNNANNAGNRNSANNPGYGKNESNTNGSSSGQPAQGSAQNPDSKETINNSSSANAGKSGSNANNSTGAATSQSQPAAWKYNTQLAEYYANLVMKPVKVGINNETYIEIIEGLSEGDEVVLPPTTTGTSSSTNKSTKVNQSANPLGGVMGGNLGGAASGQGGGFGGVR